MIQFITFELGCILHAIGTIFIVLLVCCLLLEAIGFHLIWHKAKFDVFVYWTTLLAIAVAVKVVGHLLLKTPYW